MEREWEKENLLEPSRDQQVQSEGEVQEVDPSAEEVEVATVVFGILKLQPFLLYSLLVSTLPSSNRAFRFSASLPSQFSASAGEAWGFGSYRSMQKWGAKRK